MDIQQLRLKNLVKGMSVGLVMCDARARLAAVNPAFETMSGCTAAELEVQLRPVLSSH